MSKIVLDMQNGLFAKAVQRILVQELDQVEAVVSEHPDKTLDRCREARPTAVLMEVTAYTPWKLEERLKLRDAIKAMDPGCKIVLLVDEVGDGALAERVKRAKVDGLIDLFIYGSTSASYLTALIETM